MKNRVTQPIEIPNSSHFQIIVFSSVNENNGYDCSYRKVTDIHVFTNEDDFVKAIEEIENDDRRYNKKTEYVAQKIMKKIEVKTKFEVVLS